MRARPAATAALVGVLALAACGTTEQAPSDATTPDGEAGTADTSVTVTDARGVEVTLDAPAERVAVTEWNVAEYLVSLGVEPVGVADVTGFETWDTTVELPEDVADIGGRGEPSIDTLAALDLDVLFVTGSLVEGAVEQIEETIPVVVVPGGDAADPVGSMFDNVDLVAEVTGTQDAAQTLQAEYDDAVEAARAELGDVSDVPVAFADGYDTGEAVTVRPFTSGSLIGGVLGDLGFTDAWAELPDLEADPAYGLAQVDVEGLTQLPEDTRFWYMANGDDDVFATALAENSIWTSLPFTADAVRFPDGIWGFGGPESMIRTIDAAVDAIG
ncbi:iron-siderophore ABC transporter substrate-binding protein [Actinotalea sp. BY-33]|uniref:Iron-siderophore ABC transporter substrate-binding protein n=1 Tax=Actinotalea soli TaxID=2819234 RepID=A0A939LRN8_9CELL|nr:iron-siderophore ABC transporter substrate-binding protein [Actinotalea soli]MBO1752849.1 iron-siderophore ABC transporter substrate-binding protein [Actinotalea soli]